MKLPLVTVIIPVRNEALLLNTCLSSIRALDYPQENIEIIVADGMSADETRTIAENFGADVVTNYKKTVAPGRNLAFMSAHGEYVAFTDADCVADSQWLKNAIKYFDDQSVACVGGPNHTPPDDTAFARAAGFVFGQRIFAAGSVHAVSLDEIRQVRSIPGCNAVYRKEALDKVMPIDESLLTCDDTELNQRLLDAGYKLLYTPDVFVWHHRRPSPFRLWNQMYRYAIGRLQVGRRDRRMINAVHISVGLGIPVLVAAMLLSSAVFFLLVSAGLLVIAITAFSAWFRTGSFRIAALVPSVIVIIFFAWSSGFLRELTMPLKISAGRS